MNLGSQRMLLAVVSWLATARDVDDDRGVRESRDLEEFGCAVVDDREEDPMWREVRNAWVTTCSGPGRDESWGWERFNVRIERAIWTALDVSSYDSRWVSAEGCMIG